MGYVFVRNADEFYVNLSWDKGMMAAVSTRECIAFIELLSVQNARKKFHVIRSYSIHNEQNSKNLTLFKQLEVYFFKCLSCLINTLNVSTIIDVKNFLKILKNKKLLCNNEINFLKTETNLKLFIK